MADQAITQGALRSVFDPNGCMVEHPVLQCLQIKSIAPKAGEGGQARFRLVLSDMVNFIQTMLAISANSVVQSGKLKKGSIVRLLKFNPQLVKEKKILIILELEVLEQYGEPEKIGAPTMLAEPEESAPQPAPISGNNFYGNKPAAPQPQRQQPQPQQSRPLPSHPPKPSQPSGLNLYPIESLTQYLNKWTIRALCTHKTDIKTWNNKNGPGKLFSVNLLDETGEIRATGFNEDCDRLYEVFQEGSVYYITAPCKVTFAKKQFSNLANDYELQFQRDTTVEKAEDQQNAPQVRFNFTKIGDLPSVEKDTTIDTIGVLKKVDDVSSITSKTSGKEFSKRDLTLADDSMTSVRLTVWGKTAENFDVPEDSVIAFKGVKVSDFGGKSLSLLSSGTMMVDPDIPEAHELNAWYKQNGANAHFSSHANLGPSSGGQKYKVISQIKAEEETLMSTEPVYFNLKGTVLYIETNKSFAYPACRTTGCSKKVIEEDPGKWTCEKCDVKWDKPEYRYIMRATVCDHTGQLWLNFFDEHGRIITGKSADEMMGLKFEEEENNSNVLKEAVQDMTCKTYNFRVRAKMEIYNETPRIRYQAMSVNNLNFAQECRRLTDMLKQYDLNSDTLFVQ